MRIIPKNTKVSTEFFKGVTLADMVVGFIGILIVFLIAISSLPHRGYIAIAFGFILVFLLVRVDDEANYMFFFRIIKHLSYFRSYRKPGFEYTENIELSETKEIDDDTNSMEEINEFYEEGMVSAPKMGFDSEIRTNDFNASSPKISKDVFGDEAVSEEQSGSIEIENSKEVNPLHLELEESGFEILDLDAMPVEEEFVKKTTSDIIGNKKKAPQSVLKNMRNKFSKVKKGES